MKKLIKEQQTGKKWSIRLWSSSPKHALIIIDNLDMCTVRSLFIVSTPLDSMCVSKLSEVLTSNKTIRSIHFNYCKITGDIKLIFDALVTNTTVEKLLLSGTKGITDEDITHLSEMLTVNKVLESLDLLNCKITDNHVRCICKALTENETLTFLDISCNHLITSGSTSTIADLIQRNKSLTTLHLYDISLKDDDIKTICTALTKNAMLEKLHLPGRHEEYCEKLDSYQDIKDRLEFLFY